MIWTGGRENASGIDESLALFVQGLLLMQPESSGGGAACLSKGSLPAATLQQQRPIAISTT